MYWGTNISECGPAQSLAQLQQERAELRAALESARTALEQEQTQHAAGCERERLLQDTLGATSSDLRSLQECCIVNKCVIY